MTIVLLYIAILGIVGLAAEILFAIGLGHCMKVGGAAKEDPLSGSVSRYSRRGTLFNEVV